MAAKHNLNAWRLYPILINGDSIPNLNACIFYPYTSYTQPTPYLNTCTRLRPILIHGRGPYSEKILIPYLNTWVRGG